MRVLQSMAGARHGGAEAFFTRLVPALQRAGVDQLAVIRPYPERVEALRKGDVEVVEARFGGPFDLATPLRLRGAIRRFKPDIVMSWMNRATAACPKGRFIHVSRLGGYYDLKYYRSCDHLIGNTEDIRDYLINQGWPEDRAHYVPNFAEDVVAKPFPRPSLFTPNDGRLVFAMGRLHKNKAFDVLIQAMAQVPDTYLWLAGDGPLRGELEALAERVGVKPRVRFLGWRDDVSELLAACDVFVCPSRHEPLGNVVLEAWARGKAVVAADSVGPGILIDHLESGFLVPVDDVVSLAHGIRYMFDDPAVRERLARAGRARFEAEFSEAVVVQRFVAFFEEIMGAP